MDIKPAKTEIKKISDLDFGSLDIRAEATQGTKIEADIEPHSFNFRIDSAKSKKEKAWDSTRVLKYLVMILVLSFGASMLLRYVDDLREMIIEDVRELAASSKKKKFGKVAIPVLSRVSLALKAHRPIKSTTTLESAANSAGSCSDFISESINKKLKSKLSDAEFIHVVNCSLFQDAVKTAQTTLQKAGLQLGAGVGWEGMPLSLLGLEAARRLKPLSPLPIFAKQGCLRWAALPDCYLRFVDESRLSFKSRWQDGFRVLEPVMITKSPAEISWFYLASSLYATKDGNNRGAEGYLQKARAAIRGRDNPFLEREIYHNATINAYLSNDPDLLKSAKRFRPLARVEEDPRAFLDVDLLEKIPSPEAHNLIKDYLQTSESRVRFVFDPRFLSILLKNALIYGVHKEALTFAATVFGKEPEVESFGEPLVLLYARLMVAAGMRQDALGALNGISQAGYQSPELFHLKGLAYLLPFEGKTEPLLAAKEFQMAAGISKNEESLFAMMVALLSSSNASKAEQVMKQWKSLGPKVEKSVWYVFAEGILLHRSGKTAEAAANWNRAEKMSKNKEIWITLRSNLAKDPTFFDRDIASSLRYMLPIESPLGSLALSGQKS